MQTLDPRIGNQRQKGLIAKVAAKAMARKGYVSKVGTFGKLANAGSQARGLRPNRGPGQRLSVARPQGFQDVLDGMSQGGVRSGEGYVSANPPTYYNTAPVAAALPTSLSNPMQNTLPPDVPVGAPNPNADPNGGFSGINVGTPGAPIYSDVGGSVSNPSNPAAITPTGSIFEGALPKPVGGIESKSALGAAKLSPYGPNGVPTYADIQAGLGGLQQSAPSSPITAPGGLIPLGGGRYYDPTTDKIHGAGGGW
jgi:hypothetical protein